MTFFRLVIPLFAVLVFATVLASCGGGNGGETGSDDVNSRSVGEVTADVACPQFTDSTSAEVPIPEGAIACVSLVFEFDGNFGQYIGGDFSGTEIGRSDIVPTGEGCSDHSIREPLRVSLDVGPCRAALVRFDKANMTPLMLDIGLLRYSVLRVRKKDDYSITPSGLYSEKPYTLLPEAFSTSVDAGGSSESSTEGERVVVRDVDPPLREDQVVGIRLFIVPMSVFDVVTDRVELERISDVCVKRRECTISTAVFGGNAEPAKQSKPKPSGTTAATDE